MDLINRYLNAIRWNLPRDAKADDIIAELRDVIASRIEDRQEALDRALTREETSALLRDFGHPLVVAARYGKQQWLIGPEVFPFWLFAMKIVLGIQLAVALIVAVVQAIADPWHGGATMIPALAHNISQIPWGLLAPAAIVTLVFAIVERTGGTSGYLRRWKPEQLPDLPKLKSRPKGVWNKLFEITLGAAFLLWWIGLIEIPGGLIHIKNNDMIVAEPTAVWTRFYWPILVIAAAHLIYNLVQLLRPRWRAVQALIGTATTFASLALVAMLYQAGRLVTISPGKLDAVRHATMQANVDRSIHLILLFMAAIWTLHWLSELWQMIRSRRA